jgi:hypothetical protein
MAHREEPAVMEYLIGGVILSALTCWYLFWPGALLAVYGWWLLRKDSRKIDPCSFALRRWRRRSIGLPVTRAMPSREGWDKRLRRASLALLTRILLTPMDSVGWCEIESFWDWPKWFTTELLVVAPWVQVGAAALVVGARRGTRWSSACVALGSVLLLLAFTLDMQRERCTLSELGFLD